MNGQPSPAELAEVAADAIRMLNHATRCGRGYVRSSDVNDVVALLHQAVAGLSQALGQAEQWISARYDAGHVGHDQGDAHTALSVQLLSVALATASTDSQRLAASLDLAWAEIGHLTTVTAMTGDGSC